MVGSLDPDTCVIHSIPIDMFQTLYTLYNMSNTGSAVLDDGYVGNPTSYNDGVDNNGDPGKMAYIVMDSNNDPDDYCQAPLGIGTINCDLNNDGTPDVNFGSSRGWLGLDGDMSAVSIVGNMTNGYSGKLTLPMWFPGSQGEKANAFDAITIGKPMLIPVFNMLCPNTTGPGLATNPTENPLCTDMFQSGDTYVDANGASAHPYFRVPGFAQFVVTCVVKSGPDNKFCPARTYAGIPDTGQWNSVNSIEGYFITGSVPGTSIDPDGFDLGVYVISLTK